MTCCFFGLQATVATGSCLEVRGFLSLTMFKTSSLKHAEAFAFNAHVYSNVYHVDSSVESKTCEDQC